MPIQWRPAMATGAPAIDKDHQKLIDLINAVEFAISADRIPMISLAMEDLVNYTVEHFEREEKIQSAVRYGDIEAHKLLHRKLSGRARELKEQFKSNSDDTKRKEVATELHKFLQVWLVDHFIQEDLKLKPYVMMKV